MASLDAIVNGPSGILIRKEFVNPIARRVEHLLRLLFSDIQQREAARQLGVAQSLLSRTLSGDREPSKTLLEKLGSFPYVNPRWLYDEVGEPLLRGCKSLPVLTRLPKTAATPWYEAASREEQFRISENQFSETRYWFRLTILAVKSWGEWGQIHVRAKYGDYLLLETAPTQIQAIPSRDRMAIVAHPDVEKVKPTWGILFDDMRFSWPNAGNHPKPEETSVKRPPPQRGRKITRPKGSPSSSQDTELASKSLTQVSKSANHPPEVVVKSEHVMAVVLEMISDSPLQGAR